MIYCKISGLGKGSKKIDFFKEIVLIPLLLFAAAALYLKLKYIFRHKDIAEYLAYSYFQEQSFAENL